MGSPSVALSMTFFWGIWGILDSHIYFTFFLSPHASTLPYRIRTSFFPFSRRLSRPCHMWDRAPIQFACPFIPLENNRISGVGSNEKETKEPIWSVSHRGFFGRGIHPSPNFPEKAPLLFFSSTDTE